MSSTPTLPQTPRLLAMQPPERVPTQTLEPNHSGLSETQNMEFMTRDTAQSAWKNSLFRCCSPNPGLCCYTSFCPCIIYGRTRYRLRHPEDTELKKYNWSNTGCWGIFCGSLLAYPISVLLFGAQMEEIRKTYNINGSYDEDILKALLCTICALVQAEKEVVARERGEMEDREEGQYGGRRERMEMVSARPENKEEVWT